MRQLPHILVVAFVAGFVTPVPTQIEPCLDRTIPVNIYAWREEAVTPLTSANFQASIRGKPIQVTSVTYDRGPLRIVILLDVSGSMASESRLQWGLEFARDLISSAPPQDSLALLTFNSRIVNAIAFGQDRTTFLAEVDKLQHTDWGRGKTAMQDALVSALALLKSPSVGDVICLVSDGGENASQSNSSGVEPLLESAGVRLYAFLPTWHIVGRRENPEETQGLQELRDLATSTGGDLLQFVPSQGRNPTVNAPGPFRVNEKSREELAHASQDFYREVFSFIKLNVRLPEPLAKPLHWNLDLVDASGRPNKHLHVFFPQRLAPCTSGGTH